MPNLVLAVLVGLLTSQLGLLLTTLYLHRTVTHRAVTMEPGLAFACRALVWLSTGIKPREWAAVHRRHHAYADVLGDPHSPVLEGYWKVQLWNIGLYRKAAHDPETLRKYTRDIKVDKWDRWVFDHGFIGLFIGLGILVAALGWQFALVAAAVHIVSYLLVNAAVNAVGHRWGKRPYAGIATNNQWLALLAWGEGLHSNHHAAPTAAKFSFERHQLDHAWWVMCALRKFGWLHVRHSELHFTALAQQALAKAPPHGADNPREPELV